MAEYISRDAVFQVVHGIARGIADKDIEALRAKDMKTLYKIKGAKEILDSVDTDLCYIPAADVQPVKHGRWIDCTFYDPYEKSYEQNFEYKCSCCGHMIYNKPNDDNLFCGHCSARMDLNDGDTKLEETEIDSKPFHLPCTLCGNNCQVSPLEQFKVRNELCEGREQMYRRTESYDS